MHGQLRGVYEAASYSGVGFHLGIGLLGFIGFRVLGFRVLGFRGLGFRAQGL